MAEAQIEITQAELHKIHRHGEEAYPEEGAGFLLGRMEGELKRVTAILPVTNSREDSARHNRYLLTAPDYARAEAEAEVRGLDLLGVFHSHPDHPNRPSEFDREWAMPWFSYIITSVEAGKAAGSRSWLLSEDRSQFFEETIIVPELQAAEKTKEE
jgi:proteasome lid subunit RPN8/RPN11